jgi:uncharacterized membrane protein
MLVFSWLLLLWLTGWCALPFSQRIWENTLPDAGLAAGRVLALCAWTLFAFWLGQIGVPVRVSALLMFPMLSCGLIFLWRERALLKSTLRAHWRGILVSEVFFCGAFAFFLTVRGFWPDINNGEKPMDMALISSLARAGYLPPANPYAAGLRLNSYYYFGHLQGALLSGATFITPRWGYNLLCASLPALVISTLFSLCAALTGRVRAGVFACLLVSCCGTLEPLRQWLPQVFGSPLDVRPYFATSRVIPFTINEYPFFTFCYADLHAHFFAMPVAVLMMCVAWAIWKEGASTPLVFLSAGVLAALLMTNAWDFPVYALLLVLCAWYNRPAKVLRESSFSGLRIILLALAFSFPFWMNLRSGATGLHLVWPPEMRTDSWLLLWFPFLSLYIVAFWLGRRGDNAREYSFKTRLALCGLLALLLSQLVWTGFLLPPFHRQDVVFKFGLQAWFFLGTAAACAALHRNTLRRWPTALRVACCTMIVIMLYSSFLTVFERAQNFKEWRGLDAWNHLALPEQQAASWLSHNARAGDAIFEAEKNGGGDYSEYSRYAHATGVPAVIGPQAHSFQWIGNWNEVFERKDATHALYTTPDALLRTAIERKYRARWIILGELERREYGAQNIARLERTLPIAARFGLPDDPHRVVIGRVLP